MANKRRTSTKQKTSFTRNRRLRSRRNKGRGGSVVLFLTIALIIIGAFFVYHQRPQWFERLSELVGTSSFSWLNEPHVAHGELTVTFIDVGQGDSALVRHSDGTTMLIDAGDRGLGPQIIAYLRGIGVYRIDYLVGTHPHADHIGGMEEIVRQMEIGQILMPNVQHDTRTFERLMDAIYEQGLTVRTPRPGERIAIGGAEVTILSSARPSGTNINNDSIIMKVRFGEHSFIFTGDAEHLAEGALVNKGINISATVLDAGHHGSRTSTGQEFLNAVSPQIVVIQVGADNGHGHPHREVRDRLAETGARVYRTDINGTIIITTNGADLQVNTER